MNKTLFLKGTFQSNRHPKVVVKSTLPMGDTVTDEHLYRIANQLRKVLDFWRGESLLETALVSVHFNRIIPKTRRLSFVLSQKGVKLDKCIRGVKFEDVEIKPNMKEFHKRHVFTYNVSHLAIENSIEAIEKCAEIIKRYYNGRVTAKDIEDVNDGKCPFNEIDKRKFAGFVVDCDVVHHIEVDKCSESISDNMLISLFKTEIPTKELLRRIGIDISEINMLDDCTVRLPRKDIELLQSKAPYLIAMLNDFSQYDILPSENIRTDFTEVQIPDPKEEPWIGVIDTQFDKRVYFHKWVEYIPCINEEIELEEEDFFHGTAVSSIIVDGPNVEPKLADGCGRFRVRHFGVAKKRGVGSFEVLKKIQSIVKENRDIKVWNLSLGSMLEVNESSISAEAAVLDRIQSEYDVIFIVAGTNDPENTGKRRIGSPADSINSLVVNAVKFNQKETSYARKGPVLGFFYKPDVSSYGGDKSEFISVCGPLGKESVSGTSFAAPWVTRKVAFLIYKMGLSRELAKALIIDSAAGWNRKDGTDYKIGYGVVPKNIKDVLETKDDEIRFVISGIIDEYETFNYTIPVPIYNNMQPFWSRATLAYFPYCDRNQGVDYTSTEVDLHFGRVYKKDGKSQIKEINNNLQAKEGLERIYEEDARKLYRKWDNVKIISEKLNSASRPKKVYEAGMWGLKIVTKERETEKKGKGMQFGVVVTLKEMNGVNRIGEFIKLCGMYGWLVNTIDIEASLNLYEKTDADIQWD